MKRVGQPPYRHVAAMGHGLRRVGQLLYGCFTWTSNGMGLASGVLTYALCALIVVNVLARRWHWSIIGVTEYASLALVLITFLGLAYTERQDAHIRIDLVVTRLSPRFQRVLETIIRLISAAFLIVVAYWTAQMAELSHRLGSATMQTSIDLWLIQMFVPMGLAMWAILTVLQIKDIWSKN